MRWSRAWVVGAVACFGGALGFLASCGSFAAEPGGAGADGGAGAADGAGSDAAGTDGAVADAASPDGGVPDGAPAVCPGGEACERVVFVTKQLVQGGALGSGADALCNSEAAAGNARVNGRTFVAWLSTPSVAVSKKLVHGSKPYVLPEGEVVANHWDDLISGSIRQAIDEYADGANVAPAMSVWTGSTAGGATAKTCGGWLLNTADGTVGDPTAISTSWSEAGAIGCIQFRLLYCFEK